MIYVSSACLGPLPLSEAVTKLSENGFTDIELSGGINGQVGWREDLLALQKEYGLNLLCHNYLPLAEESFVINLASLNDDIYAKSLAHLQAMITLSKKMHAKRFGFHAGFYYDIPAKDLGGDLRPVQLYDRRSCLERFCEGFGRLKEEAGEVELYIENNVISPANLAAFAGENPLMLTHDEDYQELKQRLDFNLLLDLAHLKVSTQALGLDFRGQVDRLWPHTDYIHLSDNDGSADRNLTLQEDSEIFQVVKERGLQDKIGTLEIYDSLPEIQKSYRLLRTL